jgi:hypothetical protein
MQLLISVNGTRRVTTCLRLNSDPLAPLCTNEFVRGFKTFFSLRALRRPASVSRVNSDDVERYVTRVLSLVT